MKGLYYCVFRLIFLQFGFCHLAVPYVGLGIINNVYDLHIVATDIMTVKVNSDNLDTGLG